MDPAGSESHGMYGTSMRENREIPRSPVRLITGRDAQGTRGGTPEMHERGKSDGPVVPANLPNKAAGAVAEAGEERGSAKGNTASKTPPGRSAGPGASMRTHRQHRGRTTSATATCFVNPDHASLTH